MHQTRIKFPKISLRLNGFFNEMQVLSATSLWWNPIIQVEIKKIQMFFFQKIQIHLFRGANHLQKLPASTNLPPHFFPFPVSGKWICCISFILLNKNMDNTGQKPWKKRKDLFFLALFWKYFSSSPLLRACVSNESGGTLDPPENISSKTFYAWQLCVWHFMFVILSIF